LDPRDRSGLNFLRFSVDFVLLKTHQLYRKPHSNERYCYREGFLWFRDVSEQKWIDGNAPLAADANGDEDLGSFDSFLWAGNSYRLSGDFGHVEITSSPPVVEMRAG